MLALVGFALAGLSASARGSATEETKTDTLFMGSNILVGYKNALYPVEDLNGSSWLIDVNGERQEVPTKSDHLAIKVVPAMKLSRGSASIAHLVAERGYTWANDPSVRLTRDMNAAANLNFGSQVLNNQVSALVNAQTSHMASQGFATPGQFNQADLNALLNGVNLPQVPGNGSIVRTAGISSAALAQKSVNSVATVYSPSTPGTDAEMYGQRGLSAGFDAMHVTFEIAADHVIRNPYIVTYTMFRENGTKPGMVRNLIYATTLHEIDARPQTIEVLEGGFPPDFTVVSFQLHIYEGQREIATNVASKRVDLTQEEAFEYLKIDYLNAHKGETLAASPVAGFAPANLSQAVRNGRYAKNVYVRVSKDGFPEGIFRDSLGRDSLNDPALGDIVGKIRFQPALNKGVPVEGFAPLNLHHLEF